jgi:FkbM family methyltransferase
METATAERFEREATVLNRVHDFVLRLPSFKGKARIEALLRGRLPHICETRYGFRMELDAEEWPQIELRAARCLEPRTSALFERLLRPGGVCVDAGAHVGYHSLLARHLVGDSGRVYAIEPQPHNCAMLLRNAELNGFDNIVVVAVAAGASDGWIALKAQSPRDRSRLTLTGIGVNDGAPAFVVPVITLAWLFKTQDIKRAAVLKIDVEGYELEALQGLGDSLAAVENLIVEVLPGAPSERSLAIADALREGGFQLFDVEGSTWQAGQNCIENNVWARRPSA